MSTATLSYHHLAIHELSSSAGGDPPASAGHVPDVTGNALIETRLRECIPQRGIRAGFAVIAALFALVIIGALVAGGFMVGLRQARAVAAGVQGDAAFYAAEAGLNATLANLDSLSADSLPPGAPWVLAEATLLNGDSYTVQLSRWDAGSDTGASYFLLASTGRAAGPRGGRRSVAAMLRKLPARDFCCAAALDVRGAGPVRIDSGATVSGLDSEPGLAEVGQCADVTRDDRPALITDAPELLQAAGASLEGNPAVSVTSGPGEYGEVMPWIEELSGQADLGYPPGSVLSGLGPTAWPNGECARSSPRNWGAPGLAADPCFTYFPIVHVAGDLTVVGPGSGQGVLLVDGNLWLGGGFEYRGVVLVGGSLSLGEGGASVYGGVRVADASPDTVRVAGGGWVQYSGCSVRRAMQGAKVQAPHPLAQFGWFEILE
jgi:hypothetical protein